MTTKEIIEEWIRLIHEHIENLKLIDSSHHANEGNVDQVEPAASAEQDRGRDADKLQDAAQQLVRDARALAPVKTGRLRQSIRLLGIERQGNRIVFHIGSDVEYAHFVELGVPMLHQRPTPFLRPALYSIDWRRILGNSLKNLGELRPKKALPPKLRVSFQPAL